MNPGLPAIVIMIAAPAANVPTEIWQVAPIARGKAVSVGISKTKDRAVLLIPGLKLHPFRPALSTRPERHNWQEPGSELVRTLSSEFDLYAFGYAQTASLDAIALSPGIRDTVGKLKGAGYKEIVLVGHSAGGVIARLFATHYPDSGVTKVITVASPHLGAEAAHLQIGYPRIQAPFIQSLLPETRIAARVPVPEAKPGQSIQMVCVVCKLRKLDGDGLVDLASQWPEDCRKCGVPAVLVAVNHWDAMSNPASAKAIGDLAREKLATWTSEEVEKAQKQLFGDVVVQPTARERQKLLQRRLN